MPTCKPSRGTTLRKGGSTKGQTELYAALEFFFAVIEQLDKKPSPSVEEFMASAKAIFKPVSTTGRKTLKDKRHLLQSKRSDSRHSKQTVGTRRVVLVDGGASSGRVERFLQRVLETQGSLDTPCNAFFAHLNVVLLAVTVYTFSAAIIEVYPTMSPPPESLSSVIQVASAAAGRPVFVNSFADPVRWFVIQTVPRIQSRIDHVYVMLQQMFQALIETMTIGYITANSYTAFAIGSLLFFYLRQQMMAPFVFRHAIQRPLACILEQLGVISCREHCVLSRRTVQSKRRGSRGDEDSIQEEPVS